VSDPTQPTEGSLASDATVEADPSAPSRPSGAVVRGGSVPSKLGRYHILGVAGRGGMGAVYTAEDPELGRRVAIKVLREDLAATDRDALRREAQALARLVHPNVIAVYDVGASDDRLFLVMQLVDGAPIDEWAKTATQAAIIDAFRAAGRGVAAAHEAGLVHCDLKPSNILVDRKGTVQVGDFGVARIAADDPESGHVAGTPAYMAPEQRAGKATAASDQYSFCVAMWEVLAGERPFATESNASTAAGEAIDAGARVPVRPLKAPAHVQRALLRGLALDPAARFPSMAALGAALAPPRWRRLVAIGALSALAIGATAVVAVHASHDAPVTAPPEPPKPGRADVGAIRHLTNLGPAVCAYAPTITPDGTVVFDRTEGDAVDLYAVPLAGGTPRQLTSGPAWEWRANAGRHPGEVIHLITPPNTTDTGSIAALDLATRTETTVREVAANDAVAVGNVVYFTEPGGVALHRFVGGRDEVVGAGVKGQHVINLAAAPNGARIATIGPNDAGGAQLCAYEIATAHFECLAVKPRAARPAFGADDRSLYYLGADGLRRHDLASNTDELVLSDANATGGIAGAPDGRALVISTCGSRSHIEDVSVSPPKLLVDDDTASDASFALDGTLVYTRVDKGHAVVMARTPDGRTVQVTPPTLPGVRSAIVSPDGKHVAFIEAAPHAGIHVRAVLDPGYVTEVSDSARDMLPQWIDNETLAFTRTGDDETPAVYVVSREGGTPRLELRSRFEVAARRGELLVSSSERAYWYDPKTRRERNLPPSPPDTTAMFVSPAGRWLAFAGGRAHQVIWRIDLDDPKAKIEQVVTLPKGVTNERAMITDEGHVIVEPQTWSGDLIAIPAASGTRF
jgi:predicted Ser/Thr protein kinase